MAATPRLARHAEKAVFNGSKGIRGGVPLVWPQFGPNGPLPQHGFARNLPWTVESLAANSDPSQPAVGVFTLAGSVAGEEGKEDAWTGEYKLRFTFSLWDDRLVGELSAENVGAADLWQHALQHTYYATPDVTKVAVTGLKGLTYLDKVAGGAAVQEQADSISFTCNVDRVYCDHPRTTPIAISNVGVSEDPALAGAYTATLLTHGGFHDPETGFLQPDDVDCVVWNPWVQWSLEKEDIGDEEYKTFFCVEPGRVSDRVVIAPGQRWSLVQDVTFAAHNA